MVKFIVIYNTPILSSTPSWKRLNAQQQSICLLSRVCCITQVHGKKVMNEQKSEISNNPPELVKVLAGQDRFGEHRGLGISQIAFKIVPQDSRGTLILENTFHAKGGPARHLHYNQEEWFYIVEGQFIFEVGAEKFQLLPGDSFLAPRKVPHVWAYVGEGVGKILIAFLPAGKMEAFFREVTKANAMPPQDANLWRAHEMELLGPPLSVA
jgi:quercetin 2,3-dioxygenase